MNPKVKKLFTNVRIIILLIFLILSIVAIRPNFWNEGAAVRSILPNSSASLAQPPFPQPNPNTPPMSRERILAINNQPVVEPEDYYAFIQDIGPNRTLQIRTSEGFHTLVTAEKTETIVYNDTVMKTIMETITVNETVNGVMQEVNKTVSRVVEVPRTETRSLGTADIGLRVYEAPTTNIRKGLDLQGGTRVLLQPEEELSAQDMEFLLANIKERLNVYGLSDLIVREAGDLSGNQFILVEIAGASEEEVKSLLARQGKFEGRIGNATVFRGGQDITYVCRSADCAGIDPSRGCGTLEGGWACSFRFSIALTTEAAQRQADATSKLSVIPSAQGSYLSEPLVLFLDDQAVDQLNIASDLRGRAVTEIQITGSRTGISQQEAVFNTLGDMKRLQTVLITGSLPVKLEIKKIDAISPLLGEEFIRNALLLGALSVLSVAAVIYIRYRKWRIALPIIVTVVSELTILLGAAALIGWNIDLAAIAGIVIAVGTGVDHQIVITDETLRGQRIFQSWKQRFKNAFFIIMGSYFSLVVAMLALFFAGAGLLKGFALTTIIGASIGVFITRPAFAAMVEILLND